MKYRFRAVLSALVLAAIIIGVALRLPDGSAPTAAGGVQAKVETLPTQRRHVARGSSPAEVAYQVATPMPIDRPEPWDVLFEEIVLGNIRARRTGDEPDWRGIYQLQRKIDADPRLLTEIMEYTMVEQDADALVVLHTVLIGNASAPVRDFAAQLSTAGSATQRSFAFKLLSEFPPGHDNNKLAASALASDSDPQVIASAIATLRPVSDPGAPNGGTPEPSIPATTEGERQAIQLSLQDLTLHESALVRSASLSQLSTWGAEPEVLLASATRGLADEAPEVRKAAIQAAMAHRDNANVLAFRLMDMLQDPAEDLSVQAMAYSALADTAKSSREQALYNKAYGRLAAAFGRERPEARYSR